jgi:hypothetical protein
LLSDLELRAVEVTGLNKFQIKALETEKGNQERNAYNKWAIARIPPLIIIVVMPITTTVVPAAMPA